MGVPATAHRADVPRSAPGKPWMGHYANHLRLNVRKGRDSGELVDRLLVFALIELRTRASGSTGSRAIAAAEMLRSPASPFA